MVDPQSREARVDCVGKHVYQVVGGYGSIDWLPAVPRTERVKVRDYTCDCRPIVYELCQAGGLRFIRRISRPNGRLVVEESRWSTSAVIDTLWGELLRGEAR
ncbi:hypothetical protein [Nonomuraea sp. C10]|uniref:hypothetical protein n=1 Tax=Nonomuraea sp. C10 TaxID=2600577 RepID=UPI0011CDC9C9|nr:hypothetical protein [Nonomuraea sp. C10]TXK42791.1 hypothetical protein FR742_27335 [Nonomuraea sp. C10]